MRFGGKGSSRQSKAGPAGRQSIIAGLDIGTTKVACFIARVDWQRGGARPLIAVLGVGHQVSRGIKCGCVVDMVEVEDSIRAAVSQAEDMAKTTIHEVAVSFSAGNPHSIAATAELDLEGQAVTEREMARVIGVAQSQVDLGNRLAVHAIPLSFNVDSSRGVKDPTGMFGSEIGVNLHMVTADVGPVRNLGVCVERCHLEMAGLVVGPLASGLACLVEDELDLGVTVIDMGGGTTSSAIFSEGGLVSAGVVPIGGWHVTSDLARGLSTSIAEAERFKTLYGSAFAGPSDDKSTISVPLLGEDGEDAHHTVPRSMLTSIIRPRLEETFELVRDQIEASGAERAAGRSVVLTGGASQLAGVRELAARVLGKQVRLGSPLRISGLPDAVSGPAFSGCAGLLSYLTHGSGDAFLVDSHKESHRTPHQMGRIGRWFSDIFES